MKEYHSVLLDHRSIDYIKEVFREGRGLSHLLRENAGIFDDRVTTCLPSYVPESLFYSFWDGRKIKPQEDGSLDLSENVINISKWIRDTYKVTDLKISSVPNMNSWIIQVVKDFVDKNKKNVALFENSLANSKDPWLKARKSKVVFYDRDVYHFVDYSCSSTEQIEKTIKEAMVPFPPLVLIMGSLSNDFLLKDGMNVSFDMMNSCVKNIEKLVVGAYDGEGYLLWEK